MILTPVSQGVDVEVVRHDDQHSVELEDESAERSPQGRG